MKRIAKIQESPADTIPAVPELTCEELNVREIEVQSGLEKYSPVQFNSFELPSVTIRVGPLPGEKPSQLLARARAMVDGWAHLMFDQKLQDHLKRVIATKAK